MNWPTDMLAGVFLFLFVFGFVFSIASLFLGAVGGHIHLPGHLHIGHAGHVGHHGSHSPVSTHHHTGAGHANHGHSAASTQHGPQQQASHQASTINSAPSPLNVSTAMVFFTWFGATGYILYVYNGVLAAISLLVATSVGLAGAGLVWTFLAKVLWRGQSELNPADYQLEGTVARVNSAIRLGGTGEIVYTIAGVRRTDGARSTDGVAIPSGRDVVILRYEGGLAYVAPLDWSREEVFSGAGGDHDNETRQVG